MPQKRNPDAAELVRGKTGRIIGALVGLLTVHEGPGADLFQGHAGGQGGRSSTPPRTSTLSLAAIAGMVRDMRPDAARLQQAAGAGFSTATDLADWLVRELKMPFRDAHHVTGRLVARAEAKGSDLRRPDRWPRCRRRSRASPRRSSAC